MRWFKHDSDARNSLKLRKLRRKYGADGYAIYWFCLEAIAYEVDKTNLTFELKEDAETIGFELSIQEKRVEEIMVYMIDIGLFESARGTITCLKLAERLDKSMTNSPVLRNWIGKKNVMTLSDDVSTCHELDKDKELDKNKDLKDNVQPKAKPNFDKEFELFWEHGTHSKLQMGLKKVNKAQAKKSFIAQVRKLGKDYLYSNGDDNFSGAYGFAMMLIDDIGKRCDLNQYGFENSLHPTTYLNNERWNDAHETSKQTNSKYSDGLSDSMRAIQEARAQRDANNQGFGSSMGSHDGALFEQMDSEEWSDSQQIMDGRIIDAN